MTRLKVWDANYPYYITCTVHFWLPVFSSPDCSQVIVDSLNHCINSKGLNVHAYVLMTNHLHAIVSSQGNELSSIIRDFKRHTATRVASILQDQGRCSWVNLFSSKTREPGKWHFWQEGFHPVEINTEKFFRQKIEYIHSNPIRAGYVLKPEYWRFSSAAFWLHNEHSEVEISRIAF